MSFIDLVIQHISYFAHRENVLLAMFSDPDRELALLLEVNMDAKVNYDLINWQNQVT